MLSMCAMVTNGKMKAGGSYFMISRSLGPEIGGALGIVFWAANVFSAGFYALGVAQLISNEIICNNNPSCSWNGTYAIVGLAVLLLAAMLLIALGGAEVGAGRRALHAQFNRSCSRSLQRCCFAAWCSRAWLV